MTVDQAPRLRDRLLPVSTQVAAVDRLSDRLTRVRVGHPDGSGGAYTRGSHIALAVSPGFGPFGTVRRYTISNADTDGFEFVWFRHGTAPGTHYLDLLRAGDTIRARHSDPPLRADPGLATVIVTDESGIGTTCALLPSLTAPPRIIVHTTDKANAAVLPAADAMADLAAVIAAVDARPSAQLIALGQRDTVRDLRRWAKQHAPSCVVVHRTYWAPGRAGLE